MFPNIEYIDHVLPAIEGSPEFVVAPRDGYTIINYNVCYPDTFPDLPKLTGSHSYDTLVDKMDYHNALVRRECRGLIFGEDGRIIRRPYNKFFNIGEKAETQPDQINLSTEHHILEKLDGSMLSPFFVNGRLIWGTKMGPSEVASMTSTFIHEHPHYNQFALYLIMMGYTPIFEFCSRKQRIVLDYKEDQMILTGVREMITGKYTTYSELKDLGKEFNIPVVNAIDPYEDVHSFVNYVRSLEDAEGFVVRFHDGQMFKVKSDWYVQIHRAKDRISFDRNIVEMILDNNLDDLKPHLLKEDLEKLENFERHVSTCISDWVDFLFTSVESYVRECKLDRKTFALEYADKHGPFWKPLMFALWDNNSKERAYDALIKAIRKNLSSNVRYNEVRDVVFGGYRYNEQ